MPTTIFTSTLNADNNGNQTFSFREALVITGGALGQVRVTFQAAANVSTNGAFTCSHASIGISTQTAPATANAYKTTATPVELTFSGASGFNLTTNSQTIVSDWVNLSGFTSSSILVVIIDFAATGGGNAVNAATVAGDGWFLSTASYNQSAPTGTWAFANQEVDGVTLIETQAGGANPSFSPPWVPSVATETLWQATSAPNRTISLPAAGTPFQLKRHWRWDRAEEYAWQWEAPNLTINLPPGGTPRKPLQYRPDHALNETQWQWVPQAQTIREPAQTNPTKPVWQDNAVFEYAWYASPDANITLGMLTSGGQPVGGMWTPEPAGDVHPWAWSLDNNTISQPITAPQAPLHQQWRYDPATEQAWQWSSGWSSDVLTSLTIGGKPFARTWRSDSAEQIGWTWADLSVQIQPAATSNPFHTQWRADVAEFSPWAWSYGMANVGSGFIPQQSSPFGGSWLNTVSDTQLWLWNYDNNTINQPVAVVVLPFSKEWRADVATETQWQWTNGWASDALTALVVGGQPFAKEWRWDVVPQPDWQWTPPNGTISEPLVGKPFAHLWHYDFAVDAIWQGSPLKAPLPADFAASPFSKGWHYDVVPQPDWNWTPPNVSLGLPVPGKNFGKLWRYDLAEITNWQWAAPNATLTEPEPPVHNQWRYDLTPDPVWQGAPVKQPVVGSFNTPLTVVWWPTPSQDTYWRAQAIPAQTLIGLAHKPFSKLWRYDFDDHTSWAWEPPNAAIGEPEVLPPIMPLWWRENLVPEPFWQRWSTPGISAYKPNVITADPRFVSFLPKRRMVSFLEDGMPKGPDFSLMDVGELTTGSMDFARWLEPGVTIASVVSVVASNSFPSGGAAYINLLGAPSIGVVPKIKGGSGFAGTAVLQQWVGMAVGTALVVFTVLTSDGQTLSGWAHQPVGVPS